MKKIQLAKTDYYVIIDDADYEMVSKNKWHLAQERNGERLLPARWVKVGSRYKREYLHRVITGARIGEQVDHINHDLMDCRRSNLRICNQNENLMNNFGREGTSEYKGVCWRPDKNKWEAYCHAYGRKYYGGLHGTEEEAGRKHDELALLHHGEFARLNFPVS